MKVARAIGLSSGESACRAGRRPAGSARSSPERSPYPRLAFPAVPEIAMYEVRRELVRMQALQSIRLLDRVMYENNYAPITTAAMRRASELWAEVRRQGRPTASDDALDADVILAAIAQELASEGHEVVVATTNVRHLERFVEARVWEDLG